MSGVATNFAYNTDGQLCDAEVSVPAACAGGNITYDTAGRIKSHGSWAFEYDTEGRLVQACKSTSCSGGGFDRVDLEYDAAGHRTKVVSTPAIGTAVTREFRFQGDAVTQEIVNTVVTRTYVVDDAGMIVKVIIPQGQPGEGTYVVRWNGHGDATHLWFIGTGGTLTLANSYTYGTWGSPTTTVHNGFSDLRFRFLYVGQHGVQWDNEFGLGLQYMNARHYAPPLGRFLQPDPDTEESNLYAYTTNNPVTRIDPDGTRSIALEGGGPIGGGGGGVVVISGIAMVWVWIGGVVEARGSEGPAPRWEHRR